MYVYIFLTIFGALSLILAMLVSVEWLLIVVQFACP